MQQRLPTQLLVWNVLRVVRHKIAGVRLCAEVGHVDDDVQISALDAFYEMDGRKSRYIGEVLDWYRREDARDLKRSELNELVQNKTCLNALAGESWKSNPKIVTDEKVIRRSLRTRK